MKVLKQAVTSLLLLLMVNCVMANHDSIQLTKKHSIYFGLTASKYSVRDYSTSPLIYKGIPGGINLGAEFSGIKNYTSLEYSFVYGNLTTRNYPYPDDNKCKAYNNSLSFQRAYRIGFRKSGLNYLFGGDLNILANFRNNEKFYNSNLNYEGFASLGPLIIAEKNIGITNKRSRNISLSASLAVPVLNLVVRPPYNTIEDFVNLDSYFTLKRIKFASFNKLFRVNSRIYLKYYLLNGNSFMLSYQWYYYHLYPGENNLESVGGYLSFSFVFKLNK